LGFVDWGWRSWTWQVLSYGFVLFNGMIIEPLLPTTFKIVIYTVDQPGNCGDLVNWLRENFID